MVRQGLSGCQGLSIPMVILMLVSWNWLDARNADWRDAAIARRKHAQSRGVEAPQSDGGQRGRRETGRRSPLGDDCAQIAAEGTRRKVHVRICREVFVCETTNNARMIADKCSARDSVFVCLKIKSTCCAPEIVFFSICSASGCASTAYLRCLKQAVVHLLCARSAGKRLSNWCP